MKPPNPRFTMPDDGRFILSLHAISALFSVYPPFPKNASGREEAPPSGR